MKPPVGFISTVLARLQLADHNEAQTPTSEHPVSTKAIKYTSTTTLCQVMYDPSTFTNLAHKQAYNNKRSTW